MADSKLSALTEVTVLADTDELYVNDGGESKRIAADNAGVSLLANAGVTTTVAQLNLVPGLGSSDNLLINGDFRINQRGIITGQVLAIGEYGHDNWKAGAAVGGSTYTFTQLKSSTQITISIGKSFIQVIEDANVKGTNYIVSWDGTSQARAGVGSDTPSGAYSDSPLAIAFQPAGTVMSVEFDAGTLSNAKVQEGITETPVVTRQINDELSLCKRYYEKILVGDTFRPLAAGFVLTATAAEFFLSWTEKYAVPTVVLSGAFGIHSAVTPVKAVTGNTIFYESTLGCLLSLESAGLTTGQGCLAVGNNDSDAYIEITASL